MTEVAAGHEGQGSGYDHCEIRAGQGMQKKESRRDQRVPICWQFT